MQSIQKHKSISSSKQDLSYLIKGPKSNMWSHPSNKSSKSRKTEPKQVNSTQSIVQRLIRPLQYLSNSPIAFIRKKNILVATQENIFGQVIKLIDEIEELKSTLIMQWKNLSQLKIENPEIQKQMKYHKFSQQLTSQQNKNIQMENYELEKNIQQLQLRKGNTLEDLLNLQRQKYEDTKATLCDSGQLGQQQSIIKLKKLIYDLKNERQNQLYHNCPEFENLKQENQQLHHKVIQNIRNQNQSIQQIIKLQAYLQHEEKNRKALIQELQLCKNQINRINSENCFLKQLQKHNKEESKENNGQLLNYTNIPRKSLQYKSQSANKPSSKNQNKLYQYEAIMQLMKMKNKRK